MVQNVLVVIVVYNISPYDTQAYISLSNSFKKNLECRQNIYRFFYFYDNSPNKHNLYWKDDCIYVHDENNSGVSIAYNAAFDFACKNNFQWVILSDQDTYYPSNYIESVFHYIKNGTSNIYAPTLKESDFYLSPVKFKYFRGFPFSQRLNPGIISFDSNIYPLNSGVVLGYEVFSNYAYEVNAKLDFSDFIFFGSVAKKIKSYCLMDIEVEHSLSSNKFQNLNVLLSRFSYYIAGLKSYSIINKCIYKGFIFLLLRATYLNIKYGTFKFYFHLGGYFKNQ